MQAVPQPRSGKTCGHTHRPLLWPLQRRPAVHGRAASVGAGAHTNTMMTTAYANGGRYDTTHTRGNESDPLRRSTRDVTHRPCSYER